MESMSATRPLVAAQEARQLFQNDTQSSLILRFTNAHDAVPVSTIFSGAAKAEMDPQGRVRERSFSDIVTPINNNRAFVANDNRSQIRFVAITSEYLDEDEPDAGFAELGAVMCNMGGYGLAQACISALAWRQNGQSQTAGQVYARVAEDNTPAIKIFTKHLGWNPAGYDEQRDELFKLHQPTAHAKKNRMWFHFGEMAQAMAHERLSEIRDSGVLVHRDGRKLKVQLEGLDI